MQQLKIAVVAANGKEGRLVVEAAVRGENKTNAQHAIVKDLFDLTAADLAGFDVVVDAFGAWTPDTLPQHSTSLRHLCDILAGTATRLIVVGGAGSLYLDAAHTMQLKDTPTFPEAFVPLATAMGKALDALRTRSDVKWTYISPPPISRPMANAPAPMWPPARSWRTAPTAPATSATPTTPSQSWMRPSGPRTWASASPCTPPDHSRSRRECPKHRGPPACQARRRATFHWLTGRTAVPSAS